MKRELLRAYVARMPKGSTQRQAEEEIAAIVLKVAAAVAPDFVFGYHSAEDLTQQGVLEALLAIDAGKYDPTRPLENWLQKVIRSRLFNYKRDHYLRCEAPCECCDLFGEPEHPCAKWRAWHRRNTAKMNLARPLDMATVGPESEASLRMESGVLDEVSLRETLERIDRGLPAPLRSDYLRMRAGVPIPKARRMKVRQAVLEILGHEE